MALLRRRCLPEPNATQAYDKIRQQDALRGRHGVRRQRAGPAIEVPMRQRPWTQAAWSRLFQAASSVQHEVGRAACSVVAGGSFLTARFPSTTPSGGNVSPTN